ncbi:MAG: isochorismatase family protein [Legionellaceae bacterium]|nr:isochorismatase family protein [Legionellaceae bacterium]
MFLTQNGDPKYVLGSGKKCALLVSDMQRAFTENMFNDELNTDAAMQQIISLIKVAHARGIRVIYTIISFNEAEISHPNMWLQKIPPLKILKEKTQATELDPRLPFDKESDKILIKKNTSSFFGTSLADDLLAQGIDTVIVTGCTTSGCVRATVVEGIEHGYRMMVVKEAVADRWQESHKQTLFEINAKYGDVIDISSAIEMMGN